MAFSAIEATLITGEPSLTEISFFEESILSVELDESSISDVAPSSADGASASISSSAYLELSDFASASFFSVDSETSGLEVSSETVSTGSCSVFSAEASKTGSAVFTGSEDSTGTASATGAACSAGLSSTTGAASSEAFSSIAGADTSAVFSSTTGAGTSAGFSSTTGVGTSADFSSATGSGLVSSFGSDGRNAAKGWNGEKFASPRLALISSSRELSTSYFGILLR